MQCPNCHTKYTADDLNCPVCSADLTKRANSIIPLPTNLPAVLYNSPVPRSVAASVGALAMGVGIELLRRNLLARLQQPRGLGRSLPVLHDVKDLIPQNRAPRLPKGYEIEETVMSVRRVIRRVY